jgi:DNA-binding CsgD family transcriptional regulator
MISPYTVRTHIGNILAKLDVHSRLEAVRMARSTGLLPSDQPG